MGGGFDLGAGKSVADREDEGVWFHVHDECDEPMYYGDDEPVRMKVAGSYSHRFNRANERLNRRKWKQGTPKEEIEAAFKEEVIGACILEWEGFELDGSPVPVDRKYTKKAVDTPWLYPQITRAMDDHKGFFKESSTDS